MAEAERAAAAAEAERKREEAMRKLREQDERKEVRAQRAVLRQLVLREPVAHRRVDAGRRLQRALHALPQARRPALPLEVLPLLAGHLGSALLLAALPALRPGALRQRIHRRRLGAGGHCQQGKRSRHGPNPWRTLNRG